MKLIRHITILLLFWVGAFLADAQDEVSLIDTVFHTEKTVQADSVVKTKPLVLNDSINNPIDSMTMKLAEEEQSTSFLDGPINYNSADSMAVSMDEGKYTFYLYGSASIEYGSIKLDADFISVDFSKKEIYATGLKDSTGKILSKPHFSEGSEEFDCEALRYNFVTGKGFVENVVTEQQDGVVRGARAKMINKEEYCMVDGKYSTCTAEHPHFYLKMMKGKVIKDKAIITGRSYMVLEDFPIYFPFLPYGYIPTQNTTYSSGVIIPSQGEEQNYGFYLKGGGFYWAASDYFDFKITGDAYSKGKWGLNIDTRYKLRYKFSGNFGFSYTRSVTGERGINQKVTPNFSIKWSHAQDSKANPSQTFSASVDFSSSGYSKENDYQNAELYVSNSKSSSVSYRKNFLNTPFSLSANFRASQNTKDSTVSLSLPSLNVNMKSIYPFKRKNRVGKKRFYEDIKFSYTGQYESKISTKESLLLSTPYSEWKKGIKHNIPLTLPTFKLLNYINVVPSISYNERWYFDYIERYWVDGYQVTDNETGLQKWVDGHVEEVQQDGFKRNYEYSYSLSASTTLYGMYAMKNPNSRLVAIRHKMAPSFSFSYHPDFSDIDRFGFYDMVQVDSLGNYEKYNLFTGAMYGSAGAGKSGTVSFGLSNNVEMKLLNSGKDSTNTEKYKKVPIFDDLSFRGSYNLAADSMNLSTISLNARTKIAGQSINIRGTLDPYVLNEKGKRVNDFMWNNASGLNKLGRLTSVSTGLSFSYGSDKLKKSIEKRKKAKEGGPGTNPPGEGNPEKKGKEIENLKYMPFEPSWRVSFNYSFSYTNSTGKATWRQTVGMNGGFDLTPKWKATFSSNLDIMAMKITQTTMAITRNLHCWTMSFDFAPFGTTRYYNFTLRANASMLQDLKVNKTSRSSY